MFKKSLSALAVGSVVALSLGLSAAASANSAYIGAGASMWNFSVDGISDDFSATGFTLRGGVDYNEYLGVEIHAAFGGSDSNSFRTSGINVDSEFELDMLFSSFIKGKLPITSEFRAFGLAGISYLKGTESISSIYGSYSASADDTNFAAGLGVEYDITPNFTVTGDVIRHSLDKSDYDFDTFSLVGSYRF
ncbi:MAG: porin family protein [Halomonas sp.]|nr:porin family protein [Halomonas sp.]MDP3534188.1 porin family protein [Halomonas sp.]